MIPRKSGKTFFAAALSAYELICRDDQPEVLNCANSREQASIFFDMAKGLVNQLDKNHKFTKVYKKSIEGTKNGGKLLSLSSDATTADGYSCSYGIVDEMGTGNSSDEMYQAMIQSQGARENSLVMVISTAGASRGAFYDMVETAKEQLLGNIQQDNMLPILYTLDDGDDFNNPLVWKKAAPNLGISVPVEKYEEYVMQANASNTNYLNVMIKQFNVFQQSVNVWINDRDIQACTKHLEWDDFKGADKLVFGGLDLAAVSDLTAFSAICYNSTDDKYYVKSLAWMPSDCLNKSQNNALYNQWSKDGHLILTDGNYTDHQKVLSTICGL